MSANDFKIDPKQTRDISKYQEDYNLHINLSDSKLTYIILSKNMI